MSDRWHTVKYPVARGLVEFRGPDGETRWIDPALLPGRGGKAPIHDRRDRVVALAKRKFGYVRLYLHPNWSARVVGRETY